VACLGAGIRQSQIQCLSTSALSSEDSQTRLLSVSRRTIVSKSYTIVRKWPANDKCLPVEMAAGWGFCLTFGGCVCNLVNTSCLVCISNSQSQRVNTQSERWALLRPEVRMTEDRRRRTEDGGGGTRHERRSAPNKANLWRLWARNGVSAKKQSQSGRPKVRMTEGRRWRTEDGGGDTRHERRTAPNKPNLLRFWPQNAGWAEKQSQFPGGGGVWACVGRASSLACLSRAGRTTYESPERRSLAFTGARAYIQWLV
jgi:hypothetical protein